MEGSGAPASAAAWSKCTKMGAHAIKNSPRVKVLLHKIESEGCTLASPPVTCEDAFGGAPVGGAYDTGRRAIVLNPRAPPAFLHQSEVTRAITHELVHAYDDCRAKVAWRDCRHLACTEVRAANLSGDCDFGVEFSRRPLGMLANAWAGHQGVCVRRRAEASLAQHAQCKEDAPFSVATVWSECYADVAPFSTN